MIVDWARNCERIFEEKRLTEDEPIDTKIKYKQELIYLQYLINVKLLIDKADLFEEWFKIENRCAQSVYYIEDNRQLLCEFEKIYHKAKRLVYTRINYKEHLKPVKIYKSEIDFLNGLDVPLWVKQYWAGLLFYYKFQVQNFKRVQKSRTVNSWCMRHVTDVETKRYGSNSQDRIAHYRTQLKEQGIDVFLDYLKVKNDNYPTYKPAFLANSGEVVFQAETINEIDKFIKMIKISKCTCTECGREFEKKSKTKRTLCDKCYKNYRKKYKANFIKKKREKEKDA